MKAKIIIISCFLFTLSMFAHSQSYSKISNEIRKKQLAITPKKFKGLLLSINSFHECRKTIDIFHKLDINVENDTIFILEDHAEGFGTDGMFSTIWNSSNLFSYESNSALLNDTHCSIILSHDSKFTKYMREIISAWNLKEIKREEALNSNIIPTTYIYATRVIFRKKKITVDCIYFKDFFDLKNSGLP